MSSDLRAAHTKKTRAAIQQAALTLCIENGYSSMTVDDVAHRAGVSRRTVFNHFDSKADMLLLGPILPSDAAVDAFITSTNPLRDDLRTLMVDCAATVDDQRDHFLTVRTIMRNNPELKTHLHARVMKFTDLIRAAAQARLTHQLGSEPAQDDPRVIVMTHVAAMILRSAMDIWVGACPQPSTPRHGAATSFIDAVHSVCDALDFLLPATDMTTTQQEHV